MLLATVLLSGREIDASAVGVAEIDDQPGTLLLNMLIKNEAYHLDRSLPKWAPLIDYWIIGVDDKNTDNSEEIIKKHLGHIPGQTVCVSQACELPLPACRVTCAMRAAVALWPPCSCHDIYP